MKRDVGWDSGPVAAPSPDTGEVEPSRLIVPTRMAVRPVPGPVPGMYMLLRGRASMRPGRVPKPWLFVSFICWSWSALNRGSG